MSYSHRTLDQTENIYYLTTEINFVGSFIWIRKDYQTHPIIQYRSGTVNSNTVNLKFHLIRSFFEILARILSFHV